MTGPDDERGQETCGCWHGTVSGRCMKHSVRANWDMGGEGYTCSCPRPAPQQPPAQERECAVCVGHGIDCPGGPGCQLPAPPSEADSAVGDGQDCGHHSWAGLMQLLDEHWPDDIWPTLHHDDLARDTGARLISLLRWVDQLRAQLAASSGVRGGDDQARERLADDVPWEDDHVPHRLHYDDTVCCRECSLEWPCPTVRAAGSGQ